jgi:HAD superfamily hydrolase (TIGR01484 family)
MSPKGRPEDEYRSAKHEGNLTPKGRPEDEYRSAKHEGNLSPKHAGSLPKPLASMPDRVRRGIRGVLTDIDDTLTSDGILSGRAHQALLRLRAASMPVVAITGRPAGLCERILREWPVEAVVGENGGVWMRRVKDGTVERHFDSVPAERTAQRERLATIAQRILVAVPGAALARDQGARETDIAIDWAEHVAALPADAVDRIVAMLRAEGLNTAVSSIHVHGWYGAHDKLATTRALLADVYGVDLATERESYIYVGDAPNDAPMFAFFPHAVGVANLRRFLSRLPVPPAYITAGEAGDGFAELVDFLLSSQAKFHGIK